jgi:hydroxyacylglutathione hydrolase
MSITMTPVLVLSDNYAWIITASGGRTAAVVDPGEAGPVAAWLTEHELELSAILITHHHGDHTGGVRRLTERAPVPVFGPGRESVGGMTRPLSEGDVVTLEELELQVWEVPGHTAGHIAYIGPGLALTGDTLFAGGCGRVFEGTIEQMHGSLTRLAGLPADTRIYCAHEYTAANLAFASVVEPHSSELAERVQEARRLRRQDLPTVPSSMAEELATNPFLRCEQPEVVAAASRHCGRDLQPGAEVFAEVRRWKDTWR